MSIPTNEAMTQTDRETLVKIARQRERVAKSETKERSARLLADFEKQMDRHYFYDENEIWETATKAAAEAVKAAKERIATECERLGIPKEFAPTLSMNWYGKGRNATKDARAEMRRIAQRQVEATEKAARTAIEKQSLSIQEQIMVGGLSSDDARQFLASMPTVDALMPMLAIDDVQAMIEHRGDE